MMKEERLKALSDRCDKGQHVWRHYTGNDIVDGLTFEVDPCRKTCLHFEDGSSPQYKSCLICGKTETLANVWVDVITGKANDKVELGGQE